MSPKIFSFLIPGSSSGTASSVVKFWNFICLFAPCTVREAESSFLLEGFWLIVGLMGASTWVTGGISIFFCSSSAFTVGVADLGNTLKIPPVGMRVSLLVTLIVGLAASRTTPFTRSWRMLNFLEAFSWFLLSDGNLFISSPSSFIIFGRAIYLRYLDAIPHVIGFSHRAILQSFLSS